MYHEKEELPIQEQLRPASPAGDESQAHEETPAWLTAARAAESRKAVDVRVLDLHDITSFADVFVICSGTNPRQIQAISDEVGRKLAEAGEKPTNVEGYENAEWVLMDYGNLLVHIFSAKAREYYDLERLWRHARQVPVPQQAGSTHVVAEGEL